ncbi:SoxR reducing system RseC family protein [Maribacter polysiphoniae]|uniref:RseC/MucC-like positive regulator of sigma(E) n=1 Tax=Maribacter polysiphoniae TaxID=429344 RepID=A0A316E7V6_9FLAO|nr:SoxR reducing system RseC family protein [Maribacter polysiphoniae]MBD1262375.1 SoxR reducing system RseC family protein [Maribacter polysiphoniae]PWK26075.1 RseC/MucC-like positive regulator of sigma(E) [Maribacter polysiphoniae]
MESRLSEKDAYVHSGVISKKDNGSLIISLDENVHCESCRAKSTCGISESGSKEVEISSTDESFALNEQVNVILKKGLGLKAVFWAYIFPFLLMVLTLMVSSLFLKEWMAGILSLLILVPYYLLLYVLRNVFKKTFKISVVKI